MTDAQPSPEPTAGLAACLDAAYAVKTPDDNRELYANWAATYESEFTAPNRYIYDRNVATLLLEGITDPGPVLDAGCGTGLVGAQLRRLGVRIVDGIDISADMLAKARSKTTAGGDAVYRSLTEADLTGAVDIASNTYAAIVSAGVFTHGHVGPDGLAELLRVARPGARGVIGVNSSIFESGGFKDRFERYEADGVINGLNVELRGVYERADGSEPNHMALIAVFTVV